MKTAPAPEPPRATRSTPPASAGSLHPSGPLLAAVLTVIRRDKRTHNSEAKRS
jgi:hypothetical protein